MRFGIAPPNWGPFGNPQDAIELASIAEKSGWHGYFTWDALAVRDDPPPTYDPWVILGAVATATKSIRIGTCVAVIPRYKPHLLAMTLASLDVLSGGRMTLGVGLGDWTRPQSFEKFGEVSDPRVRAEKLDEALGIITRLWSGDRLQHRGDHYIVDGFALSALPMQRPRIPIWVGGDSPPAMRRAARWDGWIGPDDDPEHSTPDNVPTVRRSLEEAGANMEAFDVAWGGVTTPDDGELVSAYGEAGVTWWIEILHGDRQQTLTRVKAGPPG